MINFASGNVTSWTDIHASSKNGRLVFVSDSAGHPRLDIHDPNALIKLLTLTISADTAEQVSGLLS